MDQLLTQPSQHPELLPEEELPPISFPDGGLKAWLVVLACFLGMICDYGLFNSVGAIESYAEDHILIHNSSTQIAWVFSVYCFITFCASLIGGVVFDIYGSKFLVMAGGLLLVGGLFAAGNCTTLWQFVLSFGICIGFGSALVMPPCINASNHFFNKRRGLAMGISNSGASIGGVIWPLMCRSLYGKVGFTWTLRILAFVFLVLMTLAFLLIDDRRDEIRKCHPPEKRPIITKSTPLYYRVWCALYLDQVIDFSLLKNPTYNFFAIALGATEMSVFIAFTYTPAFAISKGFGSSIGLLCLTILNAAGTVGRYVPTILSDRFGNFNMICCTSLVMTLALCLIWLLFGQHLVAFMVFVVVYGFSVAGTLALAPLCSAEVTVPEKFGRAFTTAYFFASFANLAGLPIGMALTSTSAGYQGMIGFCVGVSAIATICFILARFKLAGTKRVVI